MKINKLKAKNDNEPSIEDKLKLKSLNTNIQFDEADMSEVDAIFWKCKLCQKLFDYEGRFYTHFTSHLRDKIREQLSSGLRNRKCPIKNEDKSCCMSCFESLNHNKEGNLRKVKCHLILHHGLFLDEAHANKERVSMGRINNLVSIGSKNLKCPLKKEGNKYCKSSFSSFRTDNPHKMKTDLLRMKRHIAVHHGLA